MAAKRGGIRDGRLAARADWHTRVKDTEENAEDAAAPVALRADGASCA